MYNPNHLVRLSYEMHDATYDNPYYPHHSRRLPHFKRKDIESDESNQPLEDIIKRCRISTTPGVLRLSDLFTYQIT
jgi:hypothetical protein